MKKSRRQARRAESKRVSGRTTRRRFNTARFTKRKWAVFARNPKNFSLTVQRVSDAMDLIRGGEPLDSAAREELDLLLNNLYNFLWENQETARRGRPLDPRAHLMKRAAAVVRHLVEHHGIKQAAAVSAMMPEGGSPLERKTFEASLDREVRRQKAAGIESRAEWDEAYIENAASEALNRISPNKRQ